MINIIKLSADFHMIFNVTIAFLYFLLLMELAREKPSTKKIHIQTLYCVLFVMISFLFEGFFYGSIINTSVYKLSFFVQAKANLFFMMPFLSFIAFYLSYVLGEKIHSIPQVKKAYSLFIFIVFSLFVVINFMELLRFI